MNSATDIYDDEASNRTTCPFRSDKADRGNGMRFRLMVARWEDTTPGIRILASIRLLSLTAGSLGGACHPPYLGSFLT
ncbi:hypothetical protein V5785_22860, partial [Bacillus subtilis]